MNQREQIKKIAIEMVKESGLINLSRSGLSKRASIPDGSFNNIMDCTFTELVSELKNVSTNVHHKIVKTRANPELRKENILNHGIHIAIKHGCHGLTKEHIASCAGVSIGLIYHYFGTMTQLKRTVMRAAIKKEIPEIIAHGLMNNDQYAKRAPDALKAKAKIIINQMV